MKKTFPNQTRWWDIAVSFFLLAAMLTAASRLVATRWTLHLSMVQTVAFFGVLLGIALGYSRFSPRTTFFLTMVYGIIIIPWQLGQTIKGDIFWRERLSIIINRSGIVLFQIAHQDPVQDSILFLILMSTLFWGLCVFAGYTVIRYGKSWKAVLPAGLILFIIHSFDPLVTRRAWYLAFYLFFSLILVARVNFLKVQNQWQKSRTAMPPHLGLDFIRFTILTTSLIIMFAWTAPALANAFPAAQRAWQPVKIIWFQTRDRLDNAFASLRSSVMVVSKFYGSSALLGMGNPLSDAQVFTVRAPANIPPSLRLYWRARTYETYDNGQWLSTINSTFPYDPNEADLPIADEGGRWYGNFDFISAVSLTTLFTPAQPVWVNRPGQVDYVENPDNSIYISNFRAIPSLEPGQTYKSSAAVTYSSIFDLKQAGEDYPEWVAERYLQLPDSVTARARQLAEQITKDLNTPYEKTVAITNYLRNNITYIEALEEEPPNDQDIIDWFLFDYQKGFCNYYSTAEIILLRSIGIPARWAIGYAQGQPIASDFAESGRFEETTFVVRQRDAHAWPEIYFPGLGWVEFEPTVAQPEIIRPSGEQDNNITNLGLDEEAERSRRELDRELADLREERDTGISEEKPSGYLIVLLWTLVVGAALIFLIFTRRFRTKLQWISTPVFIETVFSKAGITPPKGIQLWARRATLPPLSRAYQEINIALYRLGHNPSIDETPFERAISLGNLIPPIKKSATRLVLEYQKGVFSRHHINLAVAIRSATDIKKLSFQALVQSQINRLRKFFRLPPISLN